VTTDRVRQIQASIGEHIELARRVMDELAGDIARIAAQSADVLRSGGTVFWCGNGGSAADSQHLAAELVGRFNRERKGWASVALTTNTSTLTSVGNDYGFDSIFERQVEGLMGAGDLLFALSTSGNSENVVRGVQAAKGIGAATVGLLGRDGGRLRELCDRSLVVPSSDTARIQEMHILIGHLLCDLVEQELTGETG